MKKKFKIIFFHQVATDVIKEFAADGVKYLELRSTPREEKDTGMDVIVETWYYDCMIIVTIVTRLNSWWSFR